MKSRVQSRAALPRLGKDQSSDANGADGKLISCSPALVYEATSLARFVGVKSTSSL